MSMVPEHCEGQKRKPRNTTPPITLLPYPSRLTLPLIPKHRSGMLPWTVLLNLLISSVCYIWTVLSITAQYPSVKEQIVHMSHKAILCLHYHKGMVLGQTSSPGGETPAGDCVWGLLHVSPWGTADMDTAQCCRWAPQRDVYWSAAAWTHCSMLSFRFQTKKMVTVSLHKCEEQMQQSSCVWVLFNADTEQALKLFCLSIQTKNKNQKPFW